MNLELRDICQGLLLNNFISVEASKLMKKVYFEDASTIKDQFSKLNNVSDLVVIIVY